jgi:HTH-type transcriptional regulator/antitoxin HigA
MDIRPIITEADYDWALGEVEAYFDKEPAPHSPEAARFDVLSALIAQYEIKVWPIDLPDPVEAVVFRMEQAGYSRGDLARLLGSQSRATELLKRRRRLTMEQAHRLHTAWNIPAEVLIRPYHLA